MAGIATGVDSMTPDGQMQFIDIARAPLSRTVAHTKCISETTCVPLRMAVA
jgi:hypothetical protein